MKNAAKLSLLIIFALLNSCSKSNDDKKTPDPNPVVKHKYLTQEGSTNYTYDSNKRLISASSGSAVTTYAYYDDGTLYLVTQTSGTSKTTWETTYNSDKKLSSIKIISYKNDLVQSNNTATFTYNDKGQLTQVKRDGDGGLGITRFTYNDKNVLTQTNANDGSTVTDYTYDDKKSRYTNMNATVKNYVTGGFDYIVPNNVIKASAYSGVTLQTTVYDYTYTYDSDGYPTSRTMTFKVGSQTITNTSAYTYTEL